MSKQKHILYDYDVHRCYKQHGDNYSNNNVNECNNDDQYVIINNIIDIMINHKSIIIAFNDN